MIVTTEYLGTQELLKLHKTAFLASNNIATATVLQGYDGAPEMRSRGDCIISGFNSKLEQDVLHFLLKGSQPIILVIARKMYKTIPTHLQTAIKQNRLLIISISNSTRQSKATALERNKYICHLAEKILFAGVTEQSSLYALQNTENNKAKLITL